jgi:serine/threonine protein kinase
MQERMAERPSQAGGDFVALRDRSGPADPLAPVPLPEVGSTFAEFHLIAELGRGAFGKVYLARQEALANRYVVLKISTDSFRESQRLAQLQHTDIVPIFSVHEVPPLHAVCMPYYGSTTLSDVLKTLEERATLPASGKGLVSPLTARKSMTLPVSACLASPSPPLRGRGVGVRGG